MDVGGLVCSSVTMLDSKGTHQAVPAFSSSPRVSILIFEHHFRLPTTGYIGRFDTQSCSTCPAKFIIQLPARCGIIQWHVGIVNIGGSQLFHVSGYTRLALKQRDAELNIALKRAGPGTLINICNSTVICAAELKVYKYHYMLHVDS